MKNIVNLINSLPALLPLKPATTVQISDAEKRLGVRFADEYREYVAAFGAILAEGMEMTGIAKSEYRDVVSVTKKEWELNSKIPHRMYVVENTCIDGIIIWQDTAGSIYQSKPNCEPEQVAGSLYEYISDRRKSCSK